MMSLQNNGIDGGMFSIISTSVNTTLEASSWIIHCLLPENVTIRISDHNIPILDLDDWLTEGWIFIECLALPSYPSARPALFTDENKNSCLAATKLRPSLLYMLYGTLSLFVNRRRACKSEPIFIECVTSSYTTQGLMQIIIHPCFFFPFPAFHTWWAEITNLGVVGVPPTGSHPRFWELSHQLFSFCGNTPMAFHPSFWRFFLPSF